MQINSLLGRHLDLSALNKRGESAQAASDAAPANAAGSTSNSPPSSAAREVLAQYDVTDITPRQFSEMLDKLQKTGTLGDQAYRDLAQIRADLDSSGVSPDEKIDLVSFFRQRLAKQQEAADKSHGDGKTVSPSEQAALSATENRLGWLQKFALIQSGESQGVDSVA